MKEYTIETYKHFIDEATFEHMPVPNTIDRRTYVIKAKSEKEALAKLKKLYGSVEQVDSSGKYITNPDGSWTLTNIQKVVEL